jgi:hypothetical protein
MAAVAALMAGLTRPRPIKADFAMVTVTHAEMGAESFGLGPGRA